MSEPKRNQWGQYLIPIDGKEVAHIRATTITKTLDDTSNLDKWKQRHVAKGLALRPDLFALAQATPLSEKSTLNRTCKDAIEAAAASSGRNLGTALHMFAEQFDRGEPVEIAEPHYSDIEAYRETLQRLGIEIIPEWVEVIGVNTSLSEPVAGTIDRIVRWDDKLYIADMKTGSDLKWSMGAIAQQLAIYSRSSSLFDSERQEHSPMPAVDINSGIVFHLPAGQAECTPYMVDLDAGWDAVQHAMWTRSWRKRKDLAREIE